MANFLYNGVEMPDIMAYLSSYPEVPYHYIYKNEANYVCVSSSVPLIVLSSGAIASTQRYITGTALWYFGESDKWSGGASYRERPATYSYHNISTDTLVWSSYDIINSADGSVYFAGSEPVDPNAPAYTYDRTEFLSGMAMGLTGKGDPISSMAVSGGGGGANGDGFALYNGVKLPKLPEWDKSKCPYGVVFVTTTPADGLDMYVYELRCSSVEPYANSDGEICIDGTHESAFAALILTDDDEIKKLLESSGGAAGVWSAVEYETEESSVGIDGEIWANFDYKDSSGNTVLDSSDPIPLDGMNVIEWDGDTTGLESGFCTIDADGNTIPIGTLYRISDYVSTPTDNFVVVDENPTLGTEALVLPVSELMVINGGSAWALGVSIISVDNGGVYTFGFDGTYFEFTAERGGLYCMERDISFITLFAYPASGGTTSDSFTKGYKVGAALRRKRVIPT